MPSISQRFSASLRARDHQILSAAGSASRLHPFVFDWIECPGSEPADARRCCRQHFVRRRRDLHCTAQHVGAERHDRFAGPHAEGAIRGEGPRRSIGRGVFGIGIRRSDSIGRKQLMRGTLMKTRGWFLHAGLFCKAASRLPIVRGCGCESPWRDPPLNSIIVN